MTVGLLNGKKNEPVVRDPRPKGAQKGVAKRVHQKSPHAAGGHAKARTPWLFSGSGRDGYDRRGPRWRERG
jgi:hypothetical protein